jgi:hypothetical protein
VPCVSWTGRRRVSSSYVSGDEWWFYLWGLPGSFCEETFVLHPLLLSRSSSSNNLFFSFISRNRSQTAFAYAL